MAMQGGYVRLHLLLEGRTPGLELPRALLRSLLPLVSFPGLLDGLGTGHRRGRQRCLGLLIIKIALATREGDCRLQLAPLRNQAHALGLKARVFISKLFTKQAHRVSRPPKEPLAKSATLPSTLKYVFHAVIRPKQAPGGMDQRSPSGQGAGGWHP